MQCLIAWTRGMGRISGRSGEEMITKGPAKTACHKFICSQWNQRWGLEPELCSGSPVWKPHFYNPAGPVVISVILTSKYLLLCLCLVSSITTLNAHLRLSSDSMWEPQFLGPISPFSLWPFWLLVFNLICVFFW